MQISILLFAFLMMMSFIGAYFLFMSIRQRRSQEILSAALKTTMERIHDHNTSLLEHMNISDEIMDGLMPDGDDPQFRMIRKVLESHKKMALIERERSLTMKEQFIAIMNRLLSEHKNFVE
jgi:uncharacterized membrane-anchored protein YhcB (DUF1043 family)